MEHLHYLSTVTPYPLAAHPRQWRLQCSVSGCLELLHPLPIERANRPTARTGVGVLGITDRIVGIRARTTSLPSHRASLSPHRPHRTGRLGCCPRPRRMGGWASLNPLPLWVPIAARRALDWDESDVTPDSVRWGARILIRTQPLVDRGDWDVTAEMWAWGAGIASNPCHHVTLVKGG